MFEEILKRQDIVGNKRDRERRLRLQNQLKHKRIRIELKKKADKGFSKEGKLIYFWSSLVKGSEEREGREIETG